MILLKGILITPRYYRLGKEKFKGKVLNKNPEAVFSNVCEGSLSVRFWNLTFFVLAEAVF